MGSTATLRDVAERAGVSIGTASQALNHRPSVSPETRARVIEAAQSLGYLFKDSGMIAVDRSIAVVGMLVKHDFGEPVSVNPYFSHVQAGVESECRRRGLSLMFSNIEVDARNRPMSWPAMVSEQRADGLLLIGTFLEDTVDLIQRQVSKPIIMVDGYAPSMPIDMVLIDNAQGFSLGVEHLIRLGHRHIGLLGWMEDSPPGIWERMESYLTTLKAHGISQSYIECSKLTRADGYAGVQRLLARAPQVTAVMVCNDDTAIGALYGARDLGLDVPRDFSIIGFDDIDLAKEVVPALTTIAVPKSWLGAMGVRFLLERATYPEQPKLSVRLATELLIRDSTCPPRR